MAQSRLLELQQEIIVCEKCPRLVAWREQVAVEKRSAYRDQEYWGKPVPAFGDPQAQLLICGLAPAAHGANRTGRMFTGDRSGDWLYAGLHRAGFGNQPTSTDREDDLQLHNCYITACVRCAPPTNKPTPQERDNCLGYLKRELELLPRIKVILCLGAFSWNGMLGILWPKFPGEGKKTKFSHGMETSLGPYQMLGCYHPSQQNTFTGKLTREMLDGIFQRTKALIGSEE